MAENDHSFEFTTRERCAALGSEDPTYNGLVAVTAQRQNYNAIRTLDGARPVVTATITDGALPLTGSARILVDTEGQAPADDLETIPVFGSTTALTTVALCPDGAIIYLKAKDAARVITVKNTTNVNGIRTYSGKDVVLSEKAWTSFQLQEGTWRQVITTAQTTADSAMSAVSELDESVVHKTGNEVIEGMKTFTSSSTLFGGYNALTLHALTTHGHVLSGNWDSGSRLSLQSENDTINPSAFSLCAKQKQLIGTPEGHLTWDSQEVATQNWVKDSNPTVPVGTVIWSMASTVPAGYLLCNGSSVTRAAYPELADALGVTASATSFNLPNLIGRFVEGANVAGVVKEAGLPNITGKTVNTDNWGYPNIYGNGAFQANTGGGIRYPQAVHENTSANNGVNFDASRCSKVYGKSTTVQPPSVTALPCIKAFSTVIGDATLVASQLVNDIMARTTPAQAAHAALLSNKYIDLTLGVNQTRYTAPADGFVSLSKSASVEGQYSYICIERLNTGSYVHGMPSHVVRNIQPVQAGDIYYVEYTLAGPTTHFRFIYANGAA